MKKRIKGATKTIESVVGAPIGLWKIAKHDKREDVVKKTPVVESLSEDTVDSPEDEEKVITEINKEVIPEEENSFEEAVATQSLDLF